ncbi:MAG: phosphate acyltransferase PlsX [Chloroflexota bacterium]
MRIVLDAMGSDNYPDPEVHAAVEASRTLDLEILLVGNEKMLRPRLEELKAGDLPIHLVHAPQVLEMTDKPARTARKKADNSMAVGMDLLKNGEAEAFVTAGNTGGAMANALFRLGRIRGVKRPALSAILPVVGGRAVLLDVGANVDCKPIFLLQFALMGAAYAQITLGVDNPRIGLLSNGEEPGKGNELVKETFPLLTGSGLNFIGNMEPKELYGGHADVVVTDGFTGNILVKTSEAVAKLMTDILRQELTSSFKIKIGALLSKPAFTTLKKMIDPREVGAAPLLGIDGLVFVGHGRSDAHALVSAIRLASQAVASNLLASVKESIQAKMSTLATSQDDE